MPYKLTQQPVCGVGERIGLRRPLEPSTELERLQEIKERDKKIAKMLEALELAYSLYGMSDDELMANWGSVFNKLREVINSVRGDK